jgi:hypothetical protein
MHQLKYNIDTITDHKTHFILSANSCMFWFEGVIITPYSYEPFWLHILSFFCIFSGLYIQTSVTIYDPLGSPLGEVCDVSYVRLCCTGNLYRNQELKFSFKKKTNTQ